MFVPCDEDGNVLEEPLAYNFKSVELFTNYNIKYQKAKEKVLFEGFEVQKQGGEFLVKYNEKPVWVNWNDSKKIDDLTYLQVECAVTF
jgi:hypothetical protein